MFAITPRIADNFGLISLMDDLMDPFDKYPERSMLPVQFRDGSMGHIGGRIGDSQVQNTDKEFRIRLDLSHYKPEEVKITSDNDKITIQAKHEERQDNHGFVTREMTRSYKLPKGVDPNSATSTMNANGTLSIKMNKTALEAPKDVDIPVEVKQS
ncbi:heat shock protein beta-1 [Plakobranchus ocellatus]|uniref:Heat shock protein beta-1 n=2 Tax=Plakobranchus ocellatus TaxID=259542 RepID=A0AAV3YG38_9GAST|nr:heat shock protein beta-1 [Plakobranchus ocellatus]